MSGKVTRESLALVISHKMGLPVSKASKFVDVTIARMADGIIQDEKLMLSGFGLFQVHSKKERIGRNPKTGEEVMITPRRVVSFKASRNISNPTERTDS